MKRIAGVLILLLSIFLFFLRGDVATLYTGPINSFKTELLHNQIQSLLGLLAATLGLTGTGMLLFQYLLFGSLRMVKIEDSTIQLSHRRPATEPEASSVSPNVSLAALSDEQRAAIVVDLVNRIPLEVTGKIERTFRAKYGPEVVLASKVNALREQHQVTARRLQKEVDALTRRANLNLVIGSLTTALGLGILGYMVFSGLLPMKGITDEPVSKAAVSLALSYIPRLSLIIFIQVFAFFFLRMYKANLGEVKYFQNELTNLESRFLALEGALNLDDKDSLRGVILALSRTERNFILAKDESTVDLEKARLEANNAKEIIGVLASNLANKAKGG